MEKKKKRDCIGEQGRDFLYGDFPEKCLDCDQFDICHKLTISGCLQSIADGLTLIIQNGLATNKLMGFSELDKLFEEEAKKQTKGELLTKGWSRRREDSGFT